MKRGRRVGMLALLMALFLGLTAIQGVSAVTDWLDISIDHAYYYDLDGDGLEDDIQVDFTLTVNPGIKSPSKSDYYVKLTLPSGLAYLVRLTLIGRYATIHMTFFWYDCATESGWYNINIEAFAYGGSRMGYSTANLDFDPPGTGGGEPHVKILIW